MAVCNLFKKLENNTGNFLLFSQYVEDLTLSSTQSDIYRVVPSKFITLNLNYENFDNMSFPKFLQDYYENGCAFLKMQSDITWDPTISKNLFWNALFDKQLITKGTTTINEKEFIFCNEMKSVHDINIYSYDRYNDMGYGEIYCYIPTDSKSYYIGYNENNINTDKYYKFTDKYNIGYSDQDNINTEVCNINIDEELTYYPEAKCEFSFDGSLTNEVNESEDKYDFNTIILLYDVYIKDTNTNELIPKYTNIPMGIHVCGVIDGQTTSNVNTKFVSNPDIYGAGTSYGLRVCTRFTATPNSDNIKTVDITADNDQIFASNCIIMSEMAKTLTAVNNLVEKMTNNLQTPKELLAIFKNGRTNVPYTKQIGGEPYWFVNGRNTGELATKVDVYSNYTDEEMQAGIDEFEEKLGH